MVPRLIYKISIDDRKAMQSNINPIKARQYVDDILVRGFGFSKDGETYSLLMEQDKDEIVRIILKSSGRFFNNRKLISCFSEWLLYNNVESEDQSYYLVENCLEADRQIDEGHTPIGTTHLEKISYDEQKSA
jgi:hypothetical protein